MLKKEFKLREYQKKFIHDLAVAIKQYKRIIGCAVTGAGKSKTFLTIAVNGLKKSGLTILVITESRKIFDQLINEVHAIEIKDGCKLKTIIPGNIYLAMAQTLKLRKNLIDQFNSLNESLLILNDECHINHATVILKAIPNSLLIGFSGSPVGKHLIDLYNYLVVGPQAHELVLDGFLTPYRHFERKRANINELRTDSTGEYTLESQEKVFGTDAVYDGIIEDLTNPAFEWKKALLFTSSIKACEALADRLKEAGLSCVTVHSGLKEKEAYNLFQFTNGLVPICVSVGILTKGFDFPMIDFIAQLFKTNQLPKYLQTIGRGSRVLEGEEFLPLEKRKKQKFYVFDYGQNCSRHGLWDFDRDWAALWKEKPKKKGVPLIKICPNCDYVNVAQAKVCAMCGFEFMTLNTLPEQETIDTILVEVDAKYNKLVGRAISDLTPEELCIYAKSKNKKPFAQFVATCHAVNGNRQFIKDYGKQMGYRHNWAFIILSQLDKIPEEKKIEKYTFKDVILR